MHLWPTIKLRDSFSIDYIRRLDWNLHQMKIDKRSKQRLLDDGGDQESGAPGDEGVEEEEEEEGSSSKNGFTERAAFVCREILLVLSCCYCCFCCGGEMFFIAIISLELEFAGLVLPDAVCCCCLRLLSQI
ncbi:unnamed protein product [Linum trigynum]|uniref:Uncharacterized protein n=2 Tax=Linum trigynum TaxID=586398 RepID=A0AAV2EM61_9ROSI